MDRRALRYQHTTLRLPDGRWLVTRQGAAHLAARHVDHVRKVGEVQRRRWMSGDCGAEEDPIEVLCTVPRRQILLDVDALTKEIAGRPFADWKRRRPLEEE